MSKIVNKWLAPTPAKTLKGNATPGPATPADLIASEVIALLGLNDLYLSRSAWNGTFAESFDALVTSDGSTILVELEKKGGGDLTMQFSTGLETLDCTPANTVTLTAGAATIPKTNYIYIPIATKTLTNSTTGWPTGEHIKVTFVYVQTAAYAQVDGALINQNWNDGLSGSDGMGHITHIGQWVRNRGKGASYFSGCDGAGTSGYLTIGSGTATIQVASGVITQMHKHSYAAKDTSSGDDFHVVNDNAAPYNELEDLTDITSDALGVSLNNKYFSIVLAGVANKGGEYSPLLVILPTGSYNTVTSAINDTSKYTSYELTREFTKESSTAFLIARLTLRLAGGDISLHNTQDLRGVTETVAASRGSGSGITSFADSVFEVYSTTNNTKKVILDLSVVTAGSTSILTVPDKDGTIVLLSDLVAEGVVFDPTSTDFSSTDVQAVVEEIDTALKNIEAGVVTQVIAQPVVETPSTIVRADSVDYAIPELLYEYDDTGDLDVVCTLIDRS